jgi:hypothetical protein
MNGRQLTDAQISSALRAHLPDRAPAGLRERILDAPEPTTQQRALPRFLGALSEADPRRRTLLIAAALLFALALASVAAVGALRLLERDPIRDLSLEPAPNLQDVVAPSATPGLPSDGPTSSPVARSTGFWIATGPMGTPRDGSTAVRLLDGRVLVAGGTGANHENDLTSAELYDPDSGTWSPTGNMLKPHGGFPATLLRDGKVLVGDVDDPTVYDGIPGAEVYDPATGTWSSTAKLATTDSWTAASTATLLANGQVLVAESDGAQLYDPDTGTWSATGKMVTPRYNHTATLLPDGKVLVAGGDVPPDLATESAELYDPEMWSWTATTNMRATGAHNIKATLLPDGTVLVVRSMNAELYDPATRSWTATREQPGLGTPFTTATLLMDGTVLMASGRFGSDVARTAEVYDPATGSWTETENMLRPPDSRGDYGPATLLLDGTVLVAGGSVCSEGASGCPTGATGSAQLYIPAGVSPPTGLAPVPSPTPIPIPIPTPTPTPFPAQAGPVPAGARSWKVTVVNKSPDPVTLFLAEEGETGMGPLCGSVTPNVVPAGVTEKVTFLLPPKTVKSCWIWVNPPPGGELFQTSDAPLAGRIVIIPGEEGWSVGWVSP